MTRLWTGMLAAAVISAGTAGAETLTIVVTNDNYDRQPDVSEEIDRVAVIEAADDAGYEVLRLDDASARQLRQRFTGRYESLTEAERLIFIMAGQFVTDGDETWLLGTDAQRDVDIFDAGAQGLRLGALLQIMGEKPGDALLFLVPENTAETGPGLSAGISIGEVPQGVSVVVGDGATMTGLLIDDIYGGNRPVGAAVAESGGALEGYGYLPRGGAAAAEAPDANLQATIAEFTAWRAAQRIDTEAAYVDFLETYPNGRFSGEARARLAAVERSPEELAEAEEASLRLSRDARRSIQRNLSILGFDPRGIDGIFGRGTRSAIRQWQGAQGLQVTGYLTGNQITQIEDAATQRSAELEAEAQRRQDEADRADSAYWRETGQGQTEAGLRDYLARYPDGLFSDLARDRLEDIEDARRSSVRAADQQAWDEAAAADDARGYRGYLERFPNGAYADAARGRLQEIEGTRASEDAIEAARAEEANVVANPITRLLVERRLTQLGLEPGNADGQFDDDTRRAIRRYQRARDLPVTGYVTQQTLVRMLAGN
ncbi:peptidoglycan-binding domain-containing protein [Ovoidimarina sediminis]|uniref:peptidoglycan-binding domain-containing protein n=1 Tax=Ovoidimarina sediminis TaxID=3079856 RepID=UPI002911324B|nr:peptidoglycan-binding domain-containing protein [Rhodophyticola sp. MJ-SS7]MDU8942670.1 peptidoglycan-binding domain-containing protein [Rhodophyticola sp. MJ-SS7]